MALNVVIAENLENVLVTGIKTAPTLKVNVLWDVTLCNLATEYQCFRRTRYLHHPHLYIYQDDRRFEIL